MQTEFASTTLQLTWRGVPYDGHILKILDTRKLPGITEYLICRAWGDVAIAIKDMAVRGAPAIGAAGAFGMVLASEETETEDAIFLLRYLETAADELLTTRPTAVNLFECLDRVMERARKTKTAAEIKEAVLDEAIAIAREDIVVNRAISAYGLGILPEGACVLHH